MTEQLKRRNVRIAEGVAPPRSPVVLSERGAVPPTSPAIVVTEVSTQQKPQAPPADSIQSSSNSTNAN